jgi:hypothetical protein
MKKDNIDLLGLIKNINFTRLAWIKLEDVKIIHGLELSKSN